MECAGVDCGLKMFGICVGLDGDAKQSDAASRPAASRTATPDTLARRARVCSLRFISLRPVFRGRSLSPSASLFVPRARGEAVLLPCCRAVIQVLVLMRGSELL